MEILTILLRNFETSNKVPADCATETTDSTGLSSNLSEQGRGARIALYCGTPSEQVTMGKVAQQRRQKEPEELQKRIEEQQEKLKKRAERLRRTE